MKNRSVSQKWDFAGGNKCQGLAGTGSSSSLGCCFCPRIAPEIACVYCLENHFSYQFPFLLLTGAQKARTSQVGAIQQHNRNGPELSKEKTSKQGKGKV